MGRFYQASKVNFSDYLDEFGADTGVGAVDSSLGSIEAIPQDRPRTAQIITGYESEINSLANALRTQDVATVQPRIQDLRSRIRNDFMYGELSAIRERKKRYDEIEQNIGKTLENYPTIRDKAVDLFRQSGVQPLNYNKGTFGKISVPTNIVQPYTNQDVQKWMTSVKTNVKDQILSEAQAQEIVPGKYDSILEVGRKVGVTPERAKEIVINAIPREGVESAQMFSDLSGAGRDETAVVDENGNFRTDTEWGRYAESLYNQLLKETFQGRIVKKDNFAAKQYLKDALKSKGDKDAADEFVDKFEAVWKGNPDAFDKTDPGGVVQVDNWFEGYEIGGQPIVALKKVPGAPPYLEVAADEDLQLVTPQEVPGLIEKGERIVRKGTSSYRLKGGKTRAVPLDYETIQNINIPTSVKSKVLKSLKERGLVEPSTGKVQVDPTQDVEAASQTIKRQGVQQKLNDIWKQEK